MKVANNYTRWHKKGPVSQEVDFESLLKMYHLQFCHCHKADIVKVMLHQEKKHPLLYHSRTCTWFEVKYWQQWIDTSSCHNYHKLGSSRYTLPQNQAEPKNSIPFKSVALSEITCFIKQIIWISLPFHSINQLSNNWASYINLLYAFHSHVHFILILNGLSCKASQRFFKPDFRNLAINPRRV